MYALLDSTEKIVRIVNRGQVYELVYTLDNTHQAALENLQDALVDLYSGSLELLANSSRLLSKSTAKRTGYAILHPGKTENLVSNLDKLETNLSREVQACESGRCVAVEARLTDLLHSLDAPMTRIDQGVSALLEWIDGEDEMGILEWISGIPYGDHHATVKNQRTLDTCEWLLQNERFREWEDTCSSAILWLQGSRQCTVPVILLFMWLTSSSWHRKDFPYL